MFVLKNRNYPEMSEAMQDSAILNSCSQIFIQWR